MAEPPARACPPPFQRRNRTSNASYKIHNNMKTQTLLLMAAMPGLPLNAQTPAPVAPASAPAMCEYEALVYDVTRRRG